jgi:hypothetical protein
MRIGISGVWINPDPDPEQCLRYDEYRTLYINSVVDPE